MGCLRLTPITIRRVFLEKIRPMLMIIIEAIIAHILRLTLRDMRQRMRERRENTRYWQML